MEPRLVMVSGGARGLGAAIVRRCLADGHRVSVGARRPEAVAETFGSTVHAAFFDGTEPNSADSWVAAVARDLGPPDTLINNAGILRMVDFGQGGEAELDEMWEVNVKAPFRLIRAALPHLKASGRGRVINIASTDGKRYRGAAAPLGYVLTKHALVALTHAVRHQGWDEGLRGTAICPGAIDTEMIADLPGATPKDQRLPPDAVAEIVALLLKLPNQASVPEIVANTRLESAL
ncbi:SDR family NAD(P)-dependent oxidoreductase [Rhodobacteraceae bacterium CCMM004]|nr:SDR family NAD(P)-dependent oxidoreductase [Rhodobacteraceae bacterium CCMM004]